MNSKRVMNIEDTFLYIKYRRIADLVSIAKAMRDDEISYDYITFGDFIDE